MCSGDIQPQLYDSMDVDLIREEFEEAQNRSLEGQCSSMLMISDSNKNEEKLYNAKERLRD
jgi:hypothetical protein